MADIEKTNAHMLHPSHFTATNPLSPGGVHSKRATRHRRELDDLPGFPESHRRKRKAVDDIGSPAPTRRLLENGFSTPIWTPEQYVKHSNKGTGSPLYSIDKLFTEKELHMTYNQAALAAQMYIATEKARKHFSRSSLDGSDSTSNDGDAQNGGSKVGDNEDSNSPPSAPPMARGPSHATRSTRGAGLGIANLSTPTGIDVFSDFSNSRTMNRMMMQMPRVPYPLTVYKDNDKKEKTKEKELAANYPRVANAEEIALDLQNIARARQANESEGIGRSLDVDREMLIAAVADSGTYATWLPNEKLAQAPDADIPAIKARLNSSKPKGGDDEQQGGVPMSKQSSMESGVVGGMGGVPMSRTGSGAGVTSARGRGRKRGGD